MRVTIIRADGIVGVDGVFRHVDLSAMPEGVRVMQWDGTSGHSEHDGPNTPNTAIDTIAAIQSFIDLWTAAAPPAPPEPTPEELRAAAHERINTAYRTEVSGLTAGYPDTEIASWPKQEAEARAFLDDKKAPSLWLKGAAAARQINVPNLAALIIRSADEIAPLHGALTGKRQRLRDQINALDTPTQAQLDEIQW